MEHSLLHGLQLSGIIFALGGCFFYFFVLRFSLESTETMLQSGLPRWSARAALLAGVAGIFDLLIQTAELQGQTVFSPIHFGILSRYVTLTTVGQLSLVRTVLLLASTAVLAVRWKARWVCALPLLLAGAFAGSLVSHAAALPSARFGPVLAQFLHIIAGAFWLGMLANLFLVTREVQRGGNAACGELGRIISRFSPFALAAAILLATSGLYSTFRLVSTPAAILVSPYGLTLMLKLGLLSIVLYPAFINWRVIRPAFRSAPAPEQAERLFKRFTRLMELELTAGVLVIAVAGILGSISPPGPDGSARLNRGQVEALLSPALPPARIANPKTFVGAPERTADDLHYAEFTHRWAGVFVIVLGLLWLAQSGGGDKARLCGMIWPWLLVPFGLFIAAVADPEVWILKTISWRDVFENPQLIEHQFGALLIFVLVALGFYDSCKSSRNGNRPLGYALPFLMTAGSLMLLGHAHSSIGADDDLTTLINVEHAIFGGLGLAAGLLRWLQLRTLLPKPAHFVWGICVIVLGGFMAFFYKEIY
jgi:putative copper resistance protein D